MGPEVLDITHQAAVYGEGHCEGWDTRPNRSVGVSHDVLIGRATVKRLVARRGKSSGRKVPSCANRRFLWIT